METNFERVLLEMELSESFLDVVNTLKRAFSAFRVNATKKGLTIVAEEYELEGIYKEIVEKVSSKGFKSIKPEMGFKYEFSAGTEMMKVSNPIKDKNTYRIELEFN